MRPIDADALKQQVESPYTEYPIMIQIRKALKDFIDAAPTIDVPDTNVGELGLTQLHTSNTLNALDCVDTISRQAAIDALCAVCGNDCDKSEFVYNAPQDEQVILCPEHYCLCTLPSAERRGKWIVRAETFGRRTLYYYTCPLCGSTKHQRTNYCPYCGCDMRGEDT